MLYIRKFLLKIRQIYYKLNDKQRILIGLGTIVLIGCGMAIDYFIPFNYFINILRALIAVVVGVLIFSFAYMITLIRSEKKEDYIIFRERFSYKQRLNISVVLWGVQFILLLFSTNAGMFFTFISSIIISCALATLAFIRSTREENAQAQFGMQDYRDVEFNRKRDEEFKKREEKLKEKKKNELN